MSIEDSKTAGVVASDEVARSAALGCLGGIANSVQESTVSVVTAVLALVISDKETSRA
jgi:hypothetical protein